MINTFLACYFEFVIQNKPQKVNVQQTEAARVYAASKESVFKIETNSSTGTGFLFKNSNTIVTCYHVIEGATSIKVAGSNNASWNVTQIQYNKKTDVAILTIDRPSSRKPIQPAKSIPLVGEKAFVIGNPLGFLTNSLTEGIVSAVRLDAESNATIIQVSAAISPGSSGSPILNSSNQLIAFASFTFAKGQSLNMGISFEELDKTLRSDALSIEQFFTNSKLENSKNRIDDDSSSVQPIPDLGYTERQQNEIIRLLEKIALTKIDAIERREATASQKISAVSEFSKFWTLSNMQYAELPFPPGFIRLVDSFETALNRYALALKEYYNTDRKYSDEVTLDRILEKSYERVKPMTDNVNNILTAEIRLNIILSTDLNLRKLKYDGWFKYYLSYSLLKFSEDGFASYVVPEPYSLNCELATSCLGNFKKEVAEKFFEKNPHSSFEEMLFGLSCARRGDEIIAITDTTDKWYSVKNWDQLCNVIEIVRSQIVRNQSKDKNVKLHAKVKKQNGVIETSECWILNGL
jgi:hypothetical protein